MSEWLDLMLAEIKRKQREAKQAEDENERREHGDSEDPPDAAGQSK